MSVIRLAGFSGENRALHPKLLNETVGVVLHALLLLALAVFGLVYWCCSGPSHSPSKTFHSSLKRFSSNPVFFGALNGRSAIWHEVEVFLDWFGERIFRRRSSFKPLGESLNVKTCPRSPLGQCFGFTKGVNALIPASVLQLSLHGGPSAIFWRVVAVVVDSVKRVTIRPLSHVGNKVFKTARSAPLITHRDSAPAIVFESIVFWAFTAVPHLRPNRVEGVPVATLGVPVFCDGSDVALPIKAPTGLSVQTPQGTRIHTTCVSAIAYAFPHDRPVALSSIRRNDQKPAESLPSYIDESTHLKSSVVGVHIMTQNHGAAINSTEING